MDLLGTPPRSEVFAYFLVARQTFIEGSLNQFAA
jgi:hypothetical protein